MHAYATQSGAGRPPPQADVGDDRLRCVDELPPCFRSVFSFRYFNAIQNECWPAIYGSSCNVVVAAPTGGGTAHCALLAHELLISPDCLLLP
jgi:replicative superfamily II helicase